MSARVSCSINEEGRDVHNLRFKKKARQRIKDFANLNGPALATQSRYLSTDDCWK